jgi:hypothetical protein
MITIKEFCERHRACDDDMQWAINNCSDMKDVWNKAKPELLLWIATRPEVLTDKELKLFAICAARQVQHLMTDQRSINALDVAVRYLNGVATESELASASVAARDAIRDTKDAARDAARAAALASVAASSSGRPAASSAMDAATEAARAAAWDAMNPAKAATWVAARSAPMGERAGWAVAREAARSATMELQARYLRFNCKPVFEI